jgi:hypothetical protein
MNLDDLISKYLDGELTADEDSQLRQLLSEDIAARRAFDAYVLIHAALREDAKNIVPSDALVNETEDMILGKIMAEQSAHVADVQPRRQRKVALPAVAAILLLVSVIVVSDLTIAPDKSDIALDLNRQREKLFASTSDMPVTLGQSGSETSVLAMTLPEEQFGNSKKETGTIVSAGLSGASMKKNVSDKGYIVSRNETEGNSDNHLISQSDEKISETVLIDENAGDDVPLTPEQSLDFALDFAAEEELPNVDNQSVLSFIELNNKYRTDVNTVFESQRQLHSPHSVNNLGDGNENYFYGQRSEVNLTTFFGTQMMNGGFAENTPKAILNFSQSIAYKINNTQQFGLDFGFTKYSYDYTKNILLPGISSDEVQMRDYDMMEIRETGPSSNYIEFPLTLQIQHQMIWGAGFFDQQIIANEKFNLNGRLALGGSNDGPLGYLRIYGKYNLFKWLSLNAGVDGRMFWWDEPAFGSDANSIKTSLSIIYGFEIKI